MKVLFYQMEDLFSSYKIIGCGIGAGIDEDSRTDQWSRIENSEIDPDIIVIVL